MRRSALPEVSKSLVAAISLSLMPSFFYALFRFSIGVVLPEISDEFSLDPVQAGILVSVSLAAAAATSGLSGYLSDRVGEKRVMVSGLLLFSLGLLLAMVSSRLDLFVVLITISGFGSGLMVTPAYSVVGRILPKSRGIGIGAVSSFYNVGGFVGPAFTSAIMIVTGWRIPFVVMAVSGIAVAALLSYALNISEVDLPATGPPKRTPSKLGLLRERNIVVIGAAMFLSDLGFLAFISWTPTFMRLNLSMTPEMAGFSFGVAIVAGGIGVVVMGYLFDRIGGKRAAIIGGIASAALTFLFFLQSTGSPFTIVILILAGFVASTFWSLLSALAQASVDHTQLGTATGIAQNIGYAGAVVGPSIVGSIARSGEISSALILTVSVPYLLYALLILLYKERRVSKQQFGGSHG